MSKHKQDILQLASQYLRPGRISTWHDMGIDLVIGRREDYYIYDIDGHRLLDLHLNGGTFSLGHRNPDVIAALIEATETLDIGNHHFPSEQRAELARLLAELTPGDLQYSIFCSGGSEAGDVALKTARAATGRRKIVSVEGAYHGHTGMTMPMSDLRSTEYFLATPAEGSYAKVPFNDLDAMESMLRGGDVAAVILETIPATAGFNPPADGYLQGVKTLCEQHGALYIADEVQTGLGRSGKLWAVEHYGIEPDVLITAKGLSGGIYPISAVVIGKQHAGWLTENPYGHVSTYGGAEIGCQVAQKVLEISSSAETLQNVAAIAGTLRAGLDDIRNRHSGYFREIRQVGLIMGLAFDHPSGGLHMMRALYERGVWAIMAGFDPTAIQFKPGVLWTQAHCAEVLDKFEQALAFCEAHPGETEPTPFVGMTGKH